ncbi:hypothetical protein EON80_16270 [bacterium]|nr:MAG: hypothetical protein EON80_16270 [bacterium]
MKSLDCLHSPSEETRQVCGHLMNSAKQPYFQYFNGESLSYALICSACHEAPEISCADLKSVCTACFQLIERMNWWQGIVGQPLIGERQTSLHFQHRTIWGLGVNSNDLVDIQPFEKTNGEWIGLTADNTLLRFQPNEPCTVRVLGTITTPDAQLFTALKLSPDGKLAVLYQPFGEHGVVVELESLQQRQYLQRDGYHNYITLFSVAFVVHDGRTLLVYSPKWNRLDICDPWTGELLTARDLPDDESEDDFPEHDLHYFHGQLAVSPDQQWIADDGWVWHPVGVVTTWNLHYWVTANIWESEDGKTKRELCGRDYFWNGHMCWIDNQTLAIWGYGKDDEWLIPAVLLFDVGSGKELRWFAGPEVVSHDGKKSSIDRDALIFDRYLFSLSVTKGVQVWDVESGERLLTDSSFFPKRYHRRTQEFLTCLTDGSFQLSRLADQ